MNTNIKTMTTRELLNEYNSLTGKSTTKFSSRAAGEEAVRKARAAAGHPETKNEESKMPENEQLNLLNEVIEENETETGETETGETETGETETGETETGEAEADEAEGKKAKEKAELTDEEKAAQAQRRSDAITQTWADPAVKAARTSRASAHVEWTDAEGNSRSADYDSVAKAFIDLGLPLSVHIGFRTKMRKDGTNAIKKDDIEYTFTAVEKGRVGKTAEQKAADMAAKLAKSEAKKQARIAAIESRRALASGGKRGRPAKAKPADQVNQADQADQSHGGEEQAAE